MYACRRIDEIYWTNTRSAKLYEGKKQGAGGQRERERVVVGGGLENSRVGICEAPRRCAPLARPLPSFACALCTSAGDRTPVRARRVETRTTAELAVGWRRGEYAEKEREREREVGGLR